MMDLFEKDHGTITVSRWEADGTASMRSFHYHDSYEIYYLVKGKRNYVIDDEYFSLVKGDMVLIKPGVLHKTAGGTFERIVINISELYLNRFFTSEAIEILVSCFEDKIITIPAEWRLEIIALLEKISLLLEVGREDLSFVYVTELLRRIMILREQSILVKDRTTEEGKTITKILYYVNKNYAEIENISQISDKFFITKYHLCRTFKNATNISVIEYLNRVKVKKACSLLENTEKTVTEICTECGFNSSVYFCKLFKKLMNMTPSQYREERENKRRL